MKKLLLLLTPLLLTYTSQAQTPVWSTDIAPILYNNCASCHRPSGIGPFELITYQDAVNKANAIWGSVTTGYMPPWPPDANYKRLAHERLLSKADIAKIQTWAANGTPQGDPNLAPPPPTFSSGGDLAGTPDLVTQIPKFTSTASSGDVYQCFVVPSGLSQDEYISAFEAVPGNRDIVHHVLVYADTTGICAQLDAQSPNDSGYVSFGGPGTDEAIMIGGWVPGTPPLELPNGFGIKIPKGADIVIQIHYPAGSVGQIDSTRIRFFFSKSAPVRNVRIDPILNHLDPSGLICNLIPNDGLQIPANQTKLYRQEAKTVSSVIGDATLLGIAPHMHLIGRSIKCYGVNKGDTLKFIDIPEWDFSWQGFYLFRQLQKVPAGTAFYSEAFFDNTSSNPYNPSNPPQNVTAGEATTDEMMLTYFIWTNYQTGDENIFNDNSTPVPLHAPLVAYGQQELFSPYPNPANNQLYIKYYLQQAAEVHISITDLQGREIKKLVSNKVDAGYHVKPYDVSAIPAGVYILQMNTADNQYNRKINISH